MMKVGLYSITYSGTWYKGELLMLHEQIHFNLSAEAYPQEKV